MVGGPGVFCIAFDPADRVKLRTAGFVADRSQGNTGGVGAALGPRKIPLPGGLLCRAAGALANRLPVAAAKSCSKREDVPRWWLDTSEARGPDGYNL